ncbi:MAG: LysR family transcriptional regulator [Evtepia gabavorous]
MLPADLHLRQPVPSREKVIQSQQGVSRLVHSLETELGVPLFYRGPGHQATEEGSF